jgi:hypothetical protein
MATYRTTHRHRAVPKLRKTRGFAGCVGYDCDPRAHGNVVVIDTCACGEVRRTNVNQRYTETAGWSDRERVDA